MTKQIKTQTAKISTYRVGTNFGFSAAVKVRGRVIDTIDTPRANEQAARQAGEALAVKLGYAV